MTDVFRSMWRHSKMSSLLSLLWARPCRAHGLLPPPLAGEGWGGGRHQWAADGCPLPVPPPQAGEGTLWQCLRAASGVLLVASLSSGAFAQTSPAPQPRVTIGYVDIAGDP